MPLIMRAITNPDGSPISPHMKYIVSGSGGPEYFRLPGMPWNTIVISMNAISIPDRDFANTKAEPPRSQLAQYVDDGFVTVYDTTLPGFLTADQIRNYV